MPRLFFNWALARDKQVVCEFLDNSVPQGERPRTIAFGAGGVLNILDVKGLIDIDRFRKVDIFAHGPDEVFRGVDLAAAANTSFLRDCFADGRGPVSPGRDRPRFRPPRSRARHRPRSRGPVGGGG